MKHYEKHLDSTVEDAMRDAAISNDYAELNKLINEAKKDELVSKLRRANVMPQIKEEAIRYVLNY